MNFKLDRTRPGLTTTVIGTIVLQGAGGNWATVGRRSRGGRRVHRQREKRKGKSVGLRIGTLNVGTMTGKGRELADMMERRKVDILCVQETRWKGSKARSIGAGFKLFYYGVNSKRNGVGVVLKEEFVRNVLEVKRVSDRVMSLKLEIEGVMLNVVSGYAPQVGCELEEKERFWSELDEVIESIPTGERVVIGADFNVGDEEVMGKFGVKERNLEGQMVVDFAKGMDMAVVNTYFQKREEHRVTYKSGDLEKAYDRVPREKLWYCMRKSGVAEKYVRVVQDMYERSRTVVRCAVEEVRQESPWAMMFADDIVICSESREQVEENLERWRFAQERRGMKVSRSKTEYMCVNEREGSGTVRLQGEEVKKGQEFKYLGSTVQSNGECGKEVKKRVQAGWNGWRKVSGALCDRKISARIKGKVYRTVVRPAMLYGLETVSLRKRQESELEVAELKMLRFSLGVTRLDRIRNEYIRGTAHVGRLGDKVREARLRWFGHVQRRERYKYCGRCSVCFTHPRANRTKTSTRLARTGENRRALARTGENRREPTESPAFKHRATRVKAGREKSAAMATYTRSDSCRVCPSVRGNRFDTARRKRAAPNIFEHVSEDALARLFRKAGDAKAEERVRSIFSCANDPDETARALMALKQRKKDKFLQIARTLRRLLQLRVVIVQPAVENASSAQADARYFLHRTHVCDVAARPQGLSMYCFSTASRDQVVPNVDWKLPRAKERQLGPLFSLRPPVCPFSPTERSRFLSGPGWQTLCLALAPAAIVLRSSPPSSSHLVSPRLQPISTVEQKVQLDSGDGDPFWK
ncbi:hypothetical protein QTP86_006973 [Hemibagrus guttatus]|nr:hypothetical protein QTP86_006973 [Hemibagrus guttatus]